MLMADESRAGRVKREERSETGSKSGEVRENGWASQRAGVSEWQLMCKGRSDGGCGSEWRDVGQTFDGSAARGWAAVSGWMQAVWNSLDERVKGKGRRCVGRTTENCWDSRRCRVVTE